MTDVNISKYLLFANEKKMNRRMSAIMFKLETAFHWECRGCFLLTVYTVSYIPLPNQSDYSIVMIFIQ